MKFLANNPSIFQDIEAELKHEFPSVTVQVLENGQKINDIKTIVTHDSLDAGKVVDTLLQSGADHLVQKNKDHYSLDLKIAAELIENPQNYFFNPGSVLMKDCEEFLEVPFSGAQDKAKLKEQVHHFINKVPVQNVFESVEIILEELYMNCILDAPREAKKRNHAIQNYQNGITAKARLYLNSSRLVISCEDPFGSLDVKKFANRMNEVYKKGAGEVLNFNVREGGAGLGCVLMFEQCSQLILGVEEKKRTIVSCIIPVGLSYRQRANQKKSLHLVHIQ